MNWLKELDQRYRNPAGPGYKIAPRKMKNVDSLFLIFFPMMFLIFNLLYWGSFITFNISM